MSELPPPVRATPRTYCITYRGEDSSFYFEGVTGSSLVEGRYLALVRDGGKDALINMEQVLHVTSAEEAPE